MHLRHLLRLYQEPCFCLWSAPWGSLTTTLAGREGRGCYLVREPCCLSSSHRKHTSYCQPWGRHVPPHLSPIGSPERHTRQWLDITVYSEQVQVTRWAGCPGGAGGSEPRGLRQKLH